MTMPDVLFIKTSSFGGVIHHMPALTEARRQHDRAVLLAVEPQLVVLG